MRGVARFGVVATIGGTAATAIAMSIPGQVAAASVVATVEGESMTSVQGYGTSVRSDATASGGKALRVDSAVSAHAPVKMATPGSSVTIVMRTDNTSGGGASVRIRLNGTIVATQSISKTKWTAYAVPVAIPAGVQDIRVDFLNPQKRNLYIDVARFSADGGTPTPTASPSASTSPTASPSVSPTASTSPTASPTGTSTPTPTPTSSQSSSSAEVRSQAYVTGYSYWDNTPPGSVDISNPVLHSSAGGAGTYADPITVAVGHSIISGKDILDFPAGTRFYVPNLRRYFIVEDTCGDGSTPQNGPCHKGYPAGASFWIDVWVGGGSVSKSQSDSCMAAITDVHAVIQNPAGNYVVAPGEITANCAQYGETPTVA